MAWTRVIVEDGTIIDGANSYISETDFNAYVAETGFVTTADDTVKQNAVIKACQYLNTLNYSGYKAEGRTSVMQFPRSCSTIIPDVLKTAQLWLTCYLLVDNINLYNDNTKGLQVQSKTVGPISKTFFAPSDSIERNKMRFDFIDNILRDYIVIDKIMVG